MPARVAARLEQHGDCLLWTGGRNGKGYGSMKVAPHKTALVHRVVYEAMVGPIPEDMTIDHTCLNKLCQSVSHMEVVTRSENSIRAARVRERARFAEAAERWFRHRHAA